MQSRIRLLEITIFLNIILTCCYFISITCTNRNIETAYTNNDSSSRLKWNDAKIETFFEILSSQTGTIDRNDFHLRQRGNYWVLYNYVKAEKVFGEFDSITYTTHSDFTYLDNLEPLLERWMGPVSIALYSPGSDFDETIQTIAYLRDCFQPQLVKDYVTFHLFFESGHAPMSEIPQEIPPGNCDASPAFGSYIQTYRKSKNLTYPVNVARNVAREMSSTFFVLASDIELYPSPNLPQQFLEMIQMDNFKILNSSENPKVFALPIFEVEKNITHLPQDKADLQGMLNSNLAVPFHKFVCNYCHNFPRQDEWMKAKQESSLGIFHVGKREGGFKHWEPIYIGTQFDPTYDERLSWEGQKDKMTQGYVLCLLQYEFHILNNAFLVHRPGIKRLEKKKNKKETNPRILETNSLIGRTIVPELKIMYGNHYNNCEV